MTNAKRLMVGLVVLVCGMVLSGCAQLDKCNVGKAYDFASMVSKEDPSIFVKTKSKNSIVYHDKNLTVDTGGLFGTWLTEGKGILIEIYDRDELSVGEVDASYISKLQSGEMKMSEVKGKSFGYMNDKHFGEVISLSYNGSTVRYRNSDDGWIKECIDSDKIKEGMKFNSLPTISEESVNIEEVLPFLKLVDEIRKRYQ